MHLNVEPSLQFWNTWETLWQPPEKTSLPPVSEACCQHHWYLLDNSGWWLHDLVVQIWQGCTKCLHHKLQKSEILLWNQVLTIKSTPVRILRWKTKLMQRQLQHLQQCVSLLLHRRYSFPPFQISHGSIYAMTCSAIVYLIRSVSTLGLYRAIVSCANIVNLICFVCPALWADDPVTCPLGGWLLYHKCVADFWWRCICRPALQVVEFIIVKPHEHIRDSECVRKTTFWFWQSKLKPSGKSCTQVSHRAHCKTSGMKTEASIDKFQKFTHHNI